MLYQGVLTKMETEFSKPIQYYLVLENDISKYEPIIKQEIDAFFCQIPVFELQQ